MSIRKTDTKVYFYKNDYNRVCAEIYHHPHIETGGNLFGLWTTEGNVVVHAALGPGKNCKRTDVSFHQDIEYMSRVGTFLNQKFMLCHIGEWHSYHHLTLNEPSSREIRTIRQNYPEGVKKFLVIIGNIVGNDRVVLSPYFFSKNGKTCEKGKYDVLDADSTFTTDSMIAEVMNDGAETPNHPYCSSLPNKDQQQSVPERGGRSQPTLNEPSSADKRTIRHNYPSWPTLKSRSEQTTTATPQNSGKHPRASNDLSTTNSSAASANQAKSDDNNKQTRQEAIIKKVFDEINSKLGHSVVDIERSSSSYIEMRFEHNNRHWFIRFPQSFPEKPAEIFSSYLETLSSSCQSIHRMRKFLNNHIDILLAIKSECRTFTSCCTSCRKLDVQSLAQSESSVDLFLTEEGNAMIKELWDKAEDTLAEAGSLKKEMKCDDFKKNATLEVSFTHSSMLWFIEVSSTFPSGPAKVYWKNERQFFGGSPSPVSYDSDPYSSSMDWASTVLHAIRNKCYCIKCA